MDVGLIWVNPERIYFCELDWTGQISLIQFNKFDFTRASFRQHHLHEDRGGDRDKWGCAFGFNPPGTYESDGFREGLNSSNRLKWSKIFFATCRCSAFDGWK
jgi:hypothetical protein